MYAAQESSTWPDYFQIGRIMYNYIHNYVANEGFKLPSCAPSPGQPGMHKFFHELTIIIPVRQGPFSY